jgi:hypothetical protein
MPFLHTAWSIDAPQSGPAMDQRKPPPSRRETIVIGAIVTAVGLYFVLGSLGIVPLQGKAHAPMWIVTLAGLCFLLGGLAVLIPAAVTGEVRSDGELPGGAPQWLRVAQYVFGIAIFASLASIGTWIAFGAGTRSFGISTPFFQSTGGAETLGRIVFGIGAMITWLGLIGFARYGWRKLVRRDRA